MPTGEPLDGFDYRFSFGSIQLAAKIEAFSRGLKMDNPTIIRAFAI